MQSADPKVSNVRRVRRLKPIELHTSAVKGHSPVTIRVSNLWETSTLRDSVQALIQCTGADTTSQEILRSLPHRSVSFMHLSRSETVGILTHSRLGPALRIYFRPSRLNAARKASISSGYVRAQSGGSRRYLPAVDGSRRFRSRNAGSPGHCKQNRIARCVSAAGCHLHSPCPAPGESVDVGGAASGVHLRGRCRGSCIPLSRSAHRSRVDGRGSLCLFGGGVLHTDRQENRQAGRAVCGVIARCKQPGHPINRPTLTQRRRERLSQEKNSASLRLCVEIRSLARGGHLISSRIT
jgi:hypothetical protein